MIVIGDIVNITVLILIVIVFVTGTFCTLDIAIRKFEATEKVGNFKVCKNLSQISHWPGWHQDHSGLHSSTESFFYSDARPICLLSPRIFRVSRTSSTDIFQDFLSEGAFNSLFFLILHFFSFADTCSTWAMWKKLTWPALTRRSWSRNILVLIELNLGEARVLDCGEI